MADPQLKPNPDSPSENPRRPGSYDTPAQLKPLDDAALLDLASMGNKLAMAEIYDRHAHLCYAIALRILDSSVQAESVVRETFLEIWRQPRTFRVQNCQLPAWLAIVTRIRALAVRFPAERQALESLPLPGADELSLSADQSWRLDRIKRAIAVMPADTKHVLELAWHQGFAPESIASKLGITAAAARQELRTALETMEKALLAHE